MCVANLQPLRCWVCVSLFAALTAVAQPGPAAEVEREEITTPLGGVIRHRGGEVVHAPNLTVRVRTADGDSVVGKLHVKVGADSIVLLPNGQLRCYPTLETRPTAEPFVACTPKEIWNQLQAGKYKGFKALKSEHHLYVYQCSDTFVQTVADILENMHGGVYQYCVQRGIAVHPAEVPLVVIIFARQEDYTAATKVPEEALAFYDPVVNMVALYEHPRAGSPARASYAMNLKTVAHEGVHQTLFNIGVQSRLSNWPMWLSEGLPEYFSPTTGGNSVSWKGVGFTNDMRMTSLSSLVAGRVPMPVGDLVRARGLDSDGYALAWGTTHFLAQKENKSFLAYVRHISGRKPLEDSSAEQELADFRKFFGTGAESRLGPRVTEHLSTLKWENPTKYDVHFVLLVEYVSNNTLRRNCWITLTADSLRKLQEAKLKELPEASRITANFRMVQLPSEADALRHVRTWMAEDGRKVAR